MNIERIDEETPLLTNDHDNNVQVLRKRETPTPLPKIQISILMLLQLCEPILSQSIYPYINQVCSSDLLLI